MLSIAIAIAIAIAGTGTGAPIVAAETEGRDGKSEDGKACTRK